MTVRDQVAVEAGSPPRSGSPLGRVLGGSMGGMRALEWAVTHPDASTARWSSASTAYASADQIAWAQPQLLAIRDDRRSRRRLLRRHVRAGPTAAWAWPAGSRT